MLWVKFEAAHIKRIKMFFGYDRVLWWCWRTCDYLLCIFYVMQHSSFVRERLAMLIMLLYQYCRPPCDSAIYTEVVLINCDPLYGSVFGAGAAARGMLHSSLFDAFTARIASRSDNVCFFLNHATRRVGSGKLSFFKKCLGF